MSDEINVSTDELLRKAYGSGGVEGLDDAGYAAQLGLYARTQYTFYVAFQALVVVIATAVVAALVITVLRLVDGIDPATVVAGLAAIVGGVATKFLNDSARDAKERYLEALALYKGQ
ncbi:hypothetical protein DFJ68_2905 [Terracoccus luteus]|uniref:Uncharacterized protein n=1 Tax=Terracoccus luteus TaxID=53356 RepID=A0A495Y2E2_9MICO|nr:hypothetical protein [Terracoccus luteus]RKT79434.1 hypothetical protein DFJ68_2905 [Terracoccus luteus]